MESEVIKLCAIVDGAIYHIYHNEAEQIEIPEGVTASFEERDFEYNEEHGWREAGVPIPETPEQKIARLETELTDTKTRLAIAKDIAAETSDTQQQLIELLMDMGVI